jgi:hypothetical protein
MSMGVAVRIMIEMAAVKMMTKEDTVRNTSERLCLEGDVEG